MVNQANTEEKVNAYEQERNKEEMKKQVISFALMIVLTLISFGLVASGHLESIFAIPILLMMAIIQVGFQFYYFMHLKDKGHGMPATLIYGGVWAALLTLAGLGVISWW